MSFGQPAGPPATRRQLTDLLELLEAAGHTDFRDARGPMGFNQRQAGGRFTRDEADGFIAQLTEQADSAEIMDAVGASSPEPADRGLRQRSAVVSDAKREAADARKLRRITSEVLAAELQSRGWVVIEP